MSLHLATTGTTVAVITIGGLLTVIGRICFQTSPNGDSCLYIGNTGKTHIPAPRNTIYRLKEPAELTDQTIHYIDKLTFRWSEPENECLMVEPVGNVYVVSRVDGGSGLMAKLPSFGWGGPIVDPKATSRLSIRIMIKTKDDIYCYPVLHGDFVGAVTSHAQVSYNRMEHLGESIAWTVKRDGYYTVDEGHYPPIYMYTAL